MRGYNGLYLVGNYPNPAAFVEAACLGLRYFDFLEVGLPFSDPVADGPSIEKAAAEMLRKGCTMARVYDSVKEIRKRTGPESRIYIMTYANPVFGRGIGNFARQANAAGIDGAVLPDIPYVESGRFKAPFARHEMEYIHFITPENSSEQIREIAGAARGFLYFVSIRGITGGELYIDADTKKKATLARRKSSVPVVMGFGIRDAASAASALEHADGFIMGTKAVELLNSGGIGALSSFFQALNDALG